MASADPQEIRLSLNAVPLHGLHKRGSLNPEDNPISWDQLAECATREWTLRGHTVSHGSTECQKNQRTVSCVAESKMSRFRRKCLRKTLAFRSRRSHMLMGSITRPSAMSSNRRATRRPLYRLGRRIAYGADPNGNGRYAIESTKPKVFEEAVNFKGSSRRGDAGAMPAAATIRITQPMDGETAMIASRNQSQPGDFWRCGSWERHYADQRARFGSGYL